MGNCERKNEEGDVTYADSSCKHLVLNGLVMEGVWRWFNTEAPRTIDGNRESENDKQIRGKVIACRLRSSSRSDGGRMSKFFLIVFYLFQ